MLAAFQDPRKNLVRNILALLPATQIADFDEERVTFGMINFNLYWMERRDEYPDKDLLLKDVYRDWFIEAVAHEDASDNDKMFAEFYHNLQVRTVSEV